MWLLVASVVALLVGPTLARVAGERRGPLAALDGFIVVALLGLVLLEVLPEAFEHAGPLAVGAAVVGVALPRLLEGRLHVAEGQLHGAVTWGAVFGYGVHAVLDGAALVGETSSLALGLGVVLHRVPVGVTMWWLVRPRYGVRGAAVAVAWIGATTALGFFGAGKLVAALPLGTLGLFQALVGGSLLHVVAGHGHGSEPSDIAPRSSALGALAAAAFLVGVARTGGEGDEHGFGELAGLVLGAAPFALVGGTLVQGVRALVARSRRNLLERVGIEIVAFVVALGLIDVTFAAVRLGLFLVGLAVVRALGGVRAQAASDGPGEPFAPLEVAGSQVLFGAACGALVHTGLSEAPLVGGPLGLVVAAALAAFVPMSGIASVLVAASLGKHAPLAALAFSVLAPLVALARDDEAHETSTPRGRRTASLAAMAVTVGAASLLRYGAPGLIEPLRGALPLVDRLPPAVPTAACVLLGLVLVSRLARTGARGLVESVVAPSMSGTAAVRGEHGHAHAGDPHGHAHDDAHGHAHGHSHGHAHPPRREESRRPEPVTAEADVAQGRASHPGT